MRKEPCSITRRWEWELSGSGDQRCVKKGRNSPPHPLGRESDPRLRFSQDFLALLVLVAQSAGSGDTYMGFGGGGVGGGWDVEGVCNEVSGGRSGCDRLDVGTRLKGEAVIGNQEIT